MLVSMNASTGMELLPSPIDAADPGSHLGEQLEEVAAGFCSLFLFAGKFVQIAPHQTVYRGVLFHGKRFGAALFARTCRRKEKESKSPPQPPQVAPQDESQGRPRRLDSGGAPCPLRHSSIPTSLSIRSRRIRQRRKSATKRGSC